LELSSGTHRIPDELKKHYLTDDHGAQYSTNLDRNRYGSDNNYLFTVIKHDLETLGLCPCLVDVEIIDAKAQGDSQLVTAGLETCTCARRGVVGQPVQQTVAQGECSQLFEALVAAAAGARPPSAQRSPSLVPTMPFYALCALSSRPLRALCSRAHRATRNRPPSPRPFKAVTVRGTVPAAPAWHRNETGGCIADATEQAETDTAAQDVTHELAEQSKGGTEIPVNGLLASGHGQRGELALTPSPRKRRTPRRVPTGLFSVNSSDLMGCGFSNLGNSGLVVGDLDLDRKGEVDQRPNSKRVRRTAVDADTISEQGDTDRYLKSINAEAPDASEPWRHGRVPRQHSMVGVAEGGTKDARTLMCEVQHLQQNQAVIRSTLESQKRSAVESELLIGCAA
jgi:hypothetical protein